MNKQLPQLKNELVQEIKDLTKSLQTCETFNGVLSYENKLKTLYEKFVLLKFLDQNNLSPDVLPQTEAPASEPEKSPELEKTEEVALPEAIETPKVADEPINTPVQNTTEVEDEEEKPVFYDFDTRKISREEPKTVIADFSFDEEEEELEEKGEELMRKRPSAIDEIESAFTPKKVPSTAPVYDIPPIVLDFNDRIGFLNQLFLGDDEFMDSTLDILNRLSDPNSTQMYLNDLEQEMHLDEDKREYFERLRELALKRFE
ncbi:hypothetical protein [Ornithobacterium rhinotracheale]|uniref:hypothetical protein n=1 Tax=Ornithobacterium rhinotracheale TaxID=28251 RepID=UPI001FF46D88|nr:hypothetical protein [Ornithobacterium rhinotracheale]MCK0199547.1 hypothetical protein [Ornithobacterium rhinotracheale]